MTEVIEATGHRDGYLMQAIDHIISRKAIIEVADWLSPELMRNAYIHKG